MPYEPDIWGAGWGIQGFGMEQYFLHTSFPEIFPKDAMLHALDFVLGVHPGPNNASFVSGVGSRSVIVGYGLNRADWSYIPGGSVSGTALIRPDYPELLEWPYLWQQTEYVLGGGTTDYLFLVLAADHLLNPNWRGEVVEQPPERHRPDPGGERERVGPAVDHVQPLQAKVPERHVHRPGERGRGGALELEPPAPPSPHHEKVQLGSRVSSPEVALPPVDAEAAHDRLEREPLPRRAELGMAVEIPPLADPEQRVQDPAVGQVDLRRAHLALPEVLPPGGRTRTTNVADRSSRYRSTA